MCNLRVKKRSGRFPPGAAAAWRGPRPDEGAEPQARAAAEPRGQGSWARAWRSPRLGAAKSFAMVTLQIWLSLFSFFSLRTV